MPSDETKEIHMARKLSFQRVGEGPNDWGVKSNLIHGGAHPHTGERVRVEKRDGSSKVVQLGAILDTWGGGRYRVFAIQGNGNGNGSPRGDARYGGGDERKRVMLAALGAVYDEAVSEGKVPEDAMADYLCKLISDRTGYMTVVYTP